MRSTTNFSRKEFIFVTVCIWLLMVVTFVLQALYRPVLRIPAFRMWTAAAVVTRPTTSSRRASSLHQVKIQLI